MTQPADTRLQRLLGAPELAPLRQKLRHRFEQAEPDATLTSIRLSNLAPIEHAALCQLTGRPSRLARSITLDVADLDEQLRKAHLADSLRDALERLDGPILAKAHARQALQQRWSELIDSMPASPLLRAWLNEATGALSRLKRLGRDPEGAQRLLAAANAVLLRLPARGQPLSQLAADILGDAHALDAGRPIANLVLAAWRYGERNHASTSMLEDQDDDLPSATADVAEERQRDVWARAGILVNELARPALLLNLPVVHPAQAVGSPGEPTYLSLRQLLRTPPDWDVTGKPVFICENPNLLAIMADALGSRCAPLVCTDGMPSAAQRTLLDQLRTAGARLYYHGDFDWPGISIANFVFRTWQATPWRLTANDYQIAASISAHSRPSLDQACVAASWDPLLAPAMRRCGIPIAEEAVAVELLDDLRVS